MTELCRICEKRRPRRFCPGLHGGICAQCCGEQREVSIDCPFDCEFLLESRRREKPVEIDPADIPNRDVRVPESFLREHEELIVLCARLLYESAATVPSLIDYDLREALEAMIKTRRTLESGLVYESRPANPMAAAVQQTFEQQLAAFRQRLASQTGMNTIRDSEVLGALVFLQRLERQNNNGRRRGRAFFQLLTGFLPPPPAPDASNLLA